MTNEQFPADAKQTYPDDVSPDSLMSDFRGRSIFGLIAFTVVVHLVFIGVFSIRYLKSEFLGEDTSAMNKEERLDVAVREATTSLREIAERNGISPQELGTRFADRDVQPSATTTPTLAEPITRETPPAATEPESAKEKVLEKKAEGPDLPDLAPIEEDDDLFHTMKSS